MESNMAISTISRIDDSQTLPAVVTPVGDNYHVKINDKLLLLQRDVDFGKIEGTKSPCLFKAGAERILWAYGVSTKAVVEQAIEDYQSENPFFFYRVRIECYHGDLLLTVGYGSANSREKSCGRMSPFDAANARLKMARKRAMVDAALMVGQLSSVFTQDIENEDFMQKAEKIRDVLGADDPITPKQIKRIYALAAVAGVSQAEAKKIIQGAGFASTHDITQKDYDEVCALFEVKGGSTNAD